MKQSLSMHFCTCALTAISDGIRGQRERPKYRCQAFYALSPISAKSKEFLDHVIPEHVQKTISTSFECGL